MVENISQKLLTELGIRTEDVGYKLMGELCNFVNLVRGKAGRLFRAATQHRQTISDNRSK